MRIDIDDIMPITTIILVIIFIICLTSTVQTNRQNSIARTLQYYPHCITKEQPLFCAENENIAKRYLEKARE